MPSGYSSTAAGGALTQEETAALLVEPLLAEAVVLAAGPQIFKTNGVPLRIPKINSLELTDPWRAENVQIAEVDPVYGELELLPSSLKSLKILHRISNELARHSVGNIAALLSNALTRRVALALDKAFLVGDGASNTVRGLAASTGIQVMAGVGQPSVDDLHDAVGAALGADARPSSWFMHPRDFTSLRKVKDTSGSYIVAPDPTAPAAYQLLGIPVRLSTQIPANTGAGSNESRIVLADMSQVAVGIDEDVSVTVLSERYADFDQVALRVVARLDVGVLNGPGVVLLSGITA